VDGKNLSGRVGEGQWRRIAVGDFVEVRSVEVCVGGGVRRVVGCICGEKNFVWVGGGGERVIRVHVKEVHDVVFAVLGGGLVSLENGNSRKRRRGSRRSAAVREER
jgi:hypothetical protein